MAKETLKKVLMIAYHYPPIQGSSGYLRTLKFSQYLAAFGWQPIILTVHPRCYPAASDDQLSAIPPSVEVHRVFALDTAKHLSIMGKYPLQFALPDRWWTWRIAAVAAAKKLIRTQRIDALWSTYPIASAMDIAARIKHATRIPWIADFRDSMTEAHYPPNPRQRSEFLMIEKKSVETADACVFTAPSTLAMYQDRYPAFAKPSWRVILNGYDEDNFSNASTMVAPENASKPLQLVHAGILYPRERNPIPFFDAVQTLKNENIISADKVQITLRATGHDAEYQPQLNQRGIEDIITLAPSVPYESALGEMLHADGLLLFQAGNCNHQIPAKLYEYLRANRPILALTDEAGDTAKILCEAGVTRIINIDESDSIADGLRQFFAQDDRSTFLPKTNRITQYSRREQAGQLANLLNQIT